MRTFLIFVTGFVLGLLLTEVINIFGFLLYDQTIGFKFFSILMGSVLAGMDILLHRK